MSRHKIKQRIMAMMLSAIMIMGMMPVSAFAETSTFPIGTSGEIIAFEALGADIAAQSVLLGTSEADLELPDTLTATVRLAASEKGPVLDSGEADAKPDSVDTVSGAAIGIDEIDDTEAGAEASIASPSDAQEDGDYFEAEPMEKTVDSVTEITVSLPVTWDSSLEYNCEAAVHNIFTPELPEGLTLASGVEVPAITVTVGAVTIIGTVTAFEELPENVRWQNTTAPSFPETVDGTIAGAAAKIPVIWEADHEYDAEYPARGLYVFTAVLGEGYSVAGDIELPRITVYIPQTAGGFMSRMAGGGAADASTLASTIESWAHGGEGSLIAVADDNTVTVTGNVTGAKSALSLDIASGVTVVWQAALSTETAEALIEVSGGGTFEVAEGGSVSNTTNFKKAIFVEGETSKVTVSGGTVSATGSGGIAIYAEGTASKVTVGGGTVSATGSGGHAINAKGEFSEATVSGGTVSATTGYAIYAEGESSEVTVSGGAVSATGVGGYAIKATGTSTTVAVSGGSVSATENGGIAIYAEGTASKVAISGDGKVEATSSAIGSKGSVAVKESAIVSAVRIAIRAEGTASTVEVSGGAVTASINRDTIYAEGDVTISGGTVSTTTGTAIKSTGSMVTVSGGTVSATTGTAIDTAGNVTVSDTGEVIATTGTAIDTAGNVTVSDTGAVQATAYGGSAIKTTGTDSTVEVSGGTVSATTGYAIYTNGNNVTVTVSGGTVENAAENDHISVIYLYAAPTDTSAVNVTVSGTGKVQATAGGWAICIRAKGCVEVKDDATVSATTGRAIDTTDNVTISVSGGMVSASTDTAIFTSGAGSVVEVSGGEVRATSGHAIYSYNNDVTVTVSGGIVSITTGTAIYATGTGSKITVSGGTVQATADGGTAIDTAGNVTVSGNGKVSASGVGGTAIKATGTGSKVTVSGGTVSATTGIAISAYGTNAEVMVSGGMVSGSGGTLSTAYAIYARAVTVSGDGTVSATTGTAIFAAKAVTVSGGTVSATTGRAIYADEAVVISDGTVSAPGGYAIWAESANISVSGGTVSALSGHAIYVYGIGSTVSVSGGAVSAATGYAIRATGTGPTVTVSGGAVSATMGTAIYAEGTDSTVEVSGGTVSVTTGYAIRATGTGSTVNVSGGVVYALKTALTGTSGVINDSTFTDATGTGMVIACGSGSGSRTVRTATGIAFSPAGAGAYWSQNGSDSGIAYANGTNTGFIPIAGVTVGRITLAAAHLGYAIPDVHGYTGSAQGIGAVTIGAEHNAYFNATTGGTLTVTYAGSPAAPANAGTYAVTADISGGTEYAAVTIPLGSYTIAKRGITLVADNKTVIKGGSLPELTYTVGNLPAGKTKADALSTDPVLACPTFDGNTPGSYAITLTGGTATDNYTITTRTNATLTVAEQTYTVTFNPNGGTRTGGGELMQTIPEGSTAMSPTVSRRGYTFTGWDKAFTNVTSNLTVTASWRYNGDGGGTSSDISPIIVTPPAADRPNSPTQGEIKVVGTVDSNGNVTVNITDKAVTDAFDKALAEAKKNGTEQNGITVVLRVDTSNKTRSNVTVNLPKTVQDTIIAKKIVNIVIVVDSPDIRIGMDLATVQEINRQAKSDVNITATRRDSGKLTGDAKKAIGSRPVFELRVNYGSGKAVSSFGAGSVSVTIPYTLGANEKAGNVQAVYVDENGKVHWLTNSVYNSVEKVLRFSTNHFSTYGIGYKQANTAFADIAGHWAKEDIEFVVSRGLFSGTSTTTFSPNTAMTRGMFVTALGRLANADVSSYAKSSFTDVKSDAYYMGYIEWASKNNIVNGVGNNKFAPDQSVTREQMAVIMQNYAKVIGFTLPKVHTENTFADSAKISAYAKDAVKQMQMAGVISGKNGNLFDPQGTATRAEVSAVLRRFVELAISSDTMQGWTRNDSGQWMYYENGKTATGRKEIDGSTYTFDQYGVTADVPKNLRYTTYTVQKGDSFWSISRKLNCTMAELERLNNKSRFALIHPGDVLRVPEK